MSVTVTGVPGSPQSLSWVHGGDQGLELCPLFAFLLFKRDETRSQMFRSIFVSHEGFPSLTHFPMPCLDFFSY